MSWLTCKDCGGYINTDDDPDCFVYVGNYKRLHDEIILCENCRYEREVEQDAQDAQAAHAEYLEEKSQ